MKKALPFGGAFLLSDEVDFGRFDEMVDGHQKALLFLFGQPEDVLQPLQHLGVFEQISFFRLAQKIAHRGIQDPRQFFCRLDGGDHLVPFVLADGGVGGAEGLCQSFLGKVFCFPAFRQFFSKGVHKYI